MTSNIRFRSVYLKAFVMLYCEELEFSLLGRVHGGVTKFDCLAMGIEAVVTQP